MPVLFIQLINLLDWLQGFGLRQGIYLETPGKVNNLFPLGSGRLWSKFAGSRVALLNVQNEHTSLIISYTFSPS